MRRKILYGKMVVLVPFQDRDLDYFKFLLEHDGKAIWKAAYRDFAHYMAETAANILEGRMIVWTALSNEGRASKPIGFILAEPISENTVMIHGMSDKRILHGLRDKLEKGKQTFAEDSLRTVVDHLFESFHKIEAHVLSENRTARKLLEKSGFQKEGIAKETARLDGKFVDFVLYGLVNKNELISVPEEEPQNGKEIEATVATC
jgi:RimJ/RimL family protein N-acetyltransferase